MQKTVVVAFFLVLMGAWALSGCAPDPTPEGAAAIMSVDAAKETRQIFDRAGGNWDALTPADKARLIELNNTEEQAQQTWELMKNPPGATPSGIPNAAGTR